VDEVSVPDTEVPLGLVLEVLPVAAKLEGALDLLEVLILLEVFSVCSACVNPPLAVVEIKLVDSDPSLEIKSVFATVGCSLETVVDSTPSALREGSGLFSSADSV
jgi:hypothetical protein